MKFKLLMVCFLLMASGLHAMENLEFDLLNSNNGLSSEEILDIYQDSKGYLWFITREGLNRYDGYEIKIFKPGMDDLDFNTASFECICEDSEERLWLGTSEKGILIVDQKEHQVISFAERTGRTELDGLRIRSLLYDSGGNVWIGTEYGLYRYSPESEVLNFYNLPDPRNPEPSWCIIENMIEDSRGNIWIATWSDGLHIFDRESKTFYNFIAFNESLATVNANRIKALFEDQDKHVWVGTWEDGLYRVTYLNKRLQVDEVFLYDDNNSQTIGGDIVYSINQDMHSNIWIGTPYGLTIIEDPYGSSHMFHRFSYNYNSLKGLSNNEVWKIYQDRSGLMWIGTLEGGVNKVHPNGKIFDGYGIPPVSSQIQSQTVQSFCIDPAGNLLIGVKSLGFGLFDLERGQYVPYSMTQPFITLPSAINTVNCFLLEGDRYLWLGTRYNGLLVFDYLTSDYVLVNEQTDIFTYEAVNDLYFRDDSTIWVATEDGLYSVKRCSGPSVCFEVDRIEGLSGDRITTVMEDQSGYIWIGTAENGVNRITPDPGNGTSVEFYSTARKNIPTNAIQCLFTDSKGRIWAGTSDKSLLEYDTLLNAYVQVDILKDSRVDAIFGIEEDENNNLWLTTNNGLTRMIFRENERIADNYTVADGLQGNIFVPGSMFKHGNRIYVGSYFGFNTFIPSEIRSNDYIPQTYITEIMINSEPMQVNTNDSEGIVLKYNQNNLTFRFSAMSFYKPEKNLYAYKMQGYDENWQYTDAQQRGAQYANLGPGTYTFFLKSGNSSGLWNENPVMFSIEILPAPWKTWWANLSYILVIGFILIAIYRFLLINERIKRKYEVEKIEHAKSERLNQFKLSFFTNISHELLTPLSIISCAMEVVKTQSRKNKAELAILDRNVGNLHSLLRQLLDFRKMEEGHLKLMIRKLDFQSFVEDIAMNFYPLAKKKNIRMRFSKGGIQSDNFFDSEKVEKILRNIISNAIKYTPEGGSVMVDSFVFSEDTGLWAKITISDTGIGIPEKIQDKIFQRFYRVEADHGQTGFGIGLDFTKRLVDMHKGEIKVSSVPDEGTTFTLFIPLSENFYSTEEMAVHQSEPLVVEEDSQNLKILVQSQDKSQIDGKVKLLVVDDNHDFRDVLKAYFSGRFSIEEARNGEQGLKKAIEIQPDIIVSDVMMPKMNGYELCVELKNNIDTKYIPVILLTAKNTIDEQSYGYRVGADSYMTKPVSLKMLESRINALLLKRHEYTPFQKIQFVPQPKFQKISSAELLSTVEEIVKENLSDPEFSVKELTSQLGMSNSMLYRKIKQITNLSPVDLIKRIRLNSAASLLKKGRLNISEVAYETGFSDQSYFTVCFRKKFGLTPSQYMAHQSKPQHKNQVRNKHTNLNQ